MFTRISATDYAQLESWICQQVWEKKGDLDTITDHKGNRYQLSVINHVSPQVQTSYVCSPASSADGCLPSIRQAILSFSSNAIDIYYFSPNNPVGLVSDILALYGIRQAAKLPNENSFKAKYENKLVLNLKEFFSVNEAKAHDASTIMLETLKNIPCSSVNPELEKSYSIKCCISQQSLTSRNAVLLTINNKKIVISRAGVSAVLIQGKIEDCEVTREHILKGKLSQLTENDTSCLAKTESHFFSEFYNE